MSLTATIAGNSVDISAISRPDTLDQRTTCSVTVIDSAGTAFYQKGQPIIITDSILGLIFTGFVNQPAMTLLYPSAQKMWTLDCVQSGDYLAGKRTSNRSYGNQYGGTVVVDQVQRYGAAEGLKANAALRWDELESDWASGTLSNTAATTNASNGNIGAGDLELALAGVRSRSLGGGSGFFVGNGLMLTGYASSGYSTAYVYRQIWTGSITIATNDYIIFDVWIASTSPAITASVNFTCSDGTTLNTSANTDNQGLSMAVKTDLSGLANDQWYTRYTFMTGTLVGKTITSIEVALGGTNAGMYTAYFRHISYVSGGTTTTIFGDTSTLSTYSQTLNNGYTDVSLLQVGVVNKSEVVQSVLTMATATIVRDSQLSYDTFLPDGCTALAETSIDGGATWQVHANSGDPVANLLAGMVVTGRSVQYRYTLTLGTDATAQPAIGTSTLIVNSAYNATKADVVQAYTTATDFTLGTLTNLKTVGSTSVQGITLNGIQATWDGTAPTTTSWGTGNPSQINKQIYLNVSNTFDFRLRLDFAGQWADFTTEVDVTIPASTSSSAGLVYRTTGWQAANNTYAYVVNVGPTTFQLGRGTNTSSGGGTFTSIQSVTVALTANSVHRVKVVALGSSHKIYLDGVLLITATDATYTAAGYIGLRTFNNSGTATISTPYDNFGVCAALSGTWQSPALSLAGAGSYGNSVVMWDIDGIPDTTCAISAQTSIDGGSTFQSATNGGAIPGLVAGQSLSGKSLVIKMTLIASNAPVVPTMNGVSVWVMGQYVSIGTRISPSLSLAGVGRAATALINWNASIPANTSVTAQTSLNSGSTWQTLTSPGDPITYINTQMDPNEDTFTTNSSADYVSTHMSGGSNATWTWDTAHSRLTGTGGNNDVLWYLTDVVADITVQAVMDISQNAGLVVRMLDVNNLYIAYIEDSTFGNMCTLWKVVSGTFTQIGSATLSFPTGTPHLFQLSAIGTTLTLSMDNTTLISMTDTSLQGAGKVGMHAGTSGRFYSFRMQSVGESVTSLSLLTKLILTSTDPTATPQVLDMQAFVSSSDIGSGVLIPSVSYLRTFLSDNIADQNTKSDYWTTWRNDNTLLFQAREATPAPYVLSSLNSQVIAGQVINDILVDSAELDNSGDAYRNHQIMQNAIATAQFTEIKFGDGSTTSWSVTNPLTAPPDSIILNGQSQTFGIKGVDSGKDFYYQIGSTSIDQDSSQTLLQDADSFTIIYIGSFSQDVVLDNTGQFPGTISQSMMAAIDGSSGIVESVLDLSSTPTTVEAATVQGNQLLQRFGTIGRTFKCKTLRSGFAPGQQVSVFSSEFNLSNVQMLITEVDVTIAQAPGVNGGLLYAWALTMMEGPNLGTWVQLFTNAFAPGQSSGGAGGNTVTTLFRQKNVIYVEDYGAVGDGVSDDTAALQAALSAATTGTAVQLAPTTYLVTGSLLYPGGIKITGAGDSDTGTVIKVKSGTALTTPILCSADWYNNSTTSGLPVLISDIKIDGNSATSTTSAHGFVAMNYWSSFDRMTITNVAGDGFLFTSQSKNGTHITNTCVEAKISRIQVRTCGGEGIHIQDSGSGLNSTTDGFLEACIVQSAGANAINIEMAPGWLIRGNHIYGSVTGGIVVSKCYGTRVHANYIDGFGSGTSTFVAGISMTVLNGRGSSCIGNVVGFESGTATGPYQGINITGAGSAASVCEVGFNVVNGGSQSASDGYVIQAASAQQPYSWIVYFHDNDAQNVAHYSFFDTYTQGGDLQVMHHIASLQANAPTAAAGSNAGTSPPAPVLTNCSDLDGQITFGTGTSPALGNMVVLTFNKAYATAPRVIFTPINDVTAALRWSVTSTTTNFTYKVGVAPAASQANTIYGFHYHVMA